MERETTGLEDRLNEILERHETKVFELKQKLERCLRNFRRGNNRVRRLPKTTRA